MKKTLLLLVLGLLLAGRTAYATETDAEELAVKSEQLTEEERQLLDVLELLQNFDLLDELDVLSVMEEEQ